MNKQTTVVKLTPPACSCPQCGVNRWCLMNGLDAECVSRMSALIKRRRPLQAGETIYRQGAPLTSLYIVKTGSVKTYFSAVDGVEQPVGFHFAGDLIGIDAIAHGEHGCSAVALEYTSICELPYAEFETLCQQMPQLLARLLGEIGHKLALQHELHLLLSQRSAERRVAIFLLDTGRRRAQRGFPPDELELSMSRYDIANYLGVAAETVSRTLTRFQREGLLRVDRKHLAILDRAKLLELADESLPPAERRDPVAARARLRFGGA